MGDTRLLDGLDYLLIAGLMLLGLVPRLLWFSGYGLGDDFLFRHDLAMLLDHHQVAQDNMAYRVTWWLPTALACRVFGLSETGLVLPVTVVSTLGIGLLYVFGKALWGRSAGVIAALLLIATPLDFAWSTMMNLDAFCSFFSAAAVFFQLRALALDDPAARRRAWICSAACLWLAFHAKVSALLVVPALIVVGLARRDRLDRAAWAFVRTATLLFGASVLVSYVFTGDPLAPYHVEITTQGLTGPVAIQYHRLDAATFWAYPNLLFRPERSYHVLLFGLVPHTLVLLALLAPVLRLRTSWPVFWWLVFVFLGMQLNVQRVDGVWVAGFRNIRHAHVFLYPLILLLTGFVRTLRARWRWAADLLLAVVLIVGARQSIWTANLTHVSFADCRAVCEFLPSLPPKTVVSDFQIETSCGLGAARELQYRKDLHSYDGNVRRAQIAALPDVYLVTGGGREPWYGCIDCIPLAKELDPAQWRLVKEFPGPSGATAWRPEPARIWERVKP
jgi:hypothetical protein